MVTAFDSFQCEHHGGKQRIEPRHSRFKWAARAIALLLAMALLQAASWASADDDILTPKPPATPRINGPKVFGVRPAIPCCSPLPPRAIVPCSFPPRACPKE